MNHILINLKRMFFTVVVATQILLAAAASQAQPYQTISTQNTIVGGDLSRTETTIQSGSNSLDRFRMIEVTKVGLPNQALQGVVSLCRRSEAAFIITKPLKTATTTNPLSHFLRAATLPFSVFRRVSMV